jgi:radical SAM protein with 4Fe4S-binding SPASM domain
MSKETLYKIIDDASKFPEKINDLKFVGIGEELVNPLAAELISYAVKSNVSHTVELTTNGLLLTREISDALIDCGLSRIHFSIESLTCEGYKEICGRNVDVSALIDNIRYLYNEKKKRGSKLIIYVKIPDISISTEEEKQRFFDIYGDICDEIFIECILPAWSDNLSDKFIYDNAVSLGKTEFDTPIVEKTVCTFPFYKMFISSDGRVRWCCEPRTIAAPLANVNEMSLVDIWNSRQLKEFYRLQLTGNRNSNPICKTCKIITNIGLDNIDNVKEILLNKINFGENYAGTDTTQDIRG